MVQLSGEISILVGTGHHTKGSRTPSRLPQASRVVNFAKYSLYRTGLGGVFGKESRNLKNCDEIKNQTNAKIKHSKQKENFRF